MSLKGNAASAVGAMPSAMPMGGVNLVSPCPPISQLPRTDRDDDLRRGVRLRRLGLLSLFRLLDRRGSVTTLLSHYTAGYDNSRAKRARWRPKLSRKSVWAASTLLQAVQLALGGGRKPEVSPGGNVSWHD